MLAFGAARERAENRAAQDFALLAPSLNYEGSGCRVRIGFGAYDIGFTGTTLREYDTAAVAKGRQVPPGAAALKVLASHVRHCAC